MPRTPTIEKTIDTLIILLFKDPRFNQEELNIIVTKLKEITVCIHEVIQKK